ncbi:MAG: hypothetical protein ACKOWR_01270 [Micrococcales bacterium]
MSWWTNNRWAINRANRKFLKKWMDPEWVPEFVDEFTGDNAKRIGRAMLAGETISDEEMDRMRADEASKKAIPRFKAEA